MDDLHFVHSDVVATIQARINEISHRVDKIEMDTTKLQMDTTKLQKDTANLKTRVQALVKAALDDNLL